MLGGAVPASPSAGTRFTIASSTSARPAGFRADEQRIGRIEADRRSPIILLGAGNVGALQVDPC